MRENMEYRMINLEILRELDRQFRRIIECLDSHCSLQYQRTLRYNPQRADDPRLIAYEDTQMFRLYARLTLLFPVGFQFTIDILEVLDNLQDLLVHPHPQQRDEKTDVHHFELVQDSIVHPTR